jgi:hypothetical protein
MLTADLSDVEDPGRSAERRPAGRKRLARSGSVVPLVLAVSCTVVALDQFLHTSPAALLASPADQTLHWLADVLLAIPLTTIALWAGGWLSGWLRISTTGVAGVFAQASVIALVLAVLLVPAWFAHYAINNLAASPVHPSAPSGLSDHSDHAGHSHGGPPVETYWVASGVIYALMAIPLAAAAVCAGLRVASRLVRRLGGEADVMVRVAVVVGASALALTLGLFLQGVANPSGGLVTYANYLAVVHADLDFVHAHHASVTEAVVQPAFGYKLASAVQGGLAGQAIGLPVAFLGLLWVNRRKRGDGKANALAS